MLFLIDDQEFTTQKQVLNYANALGISAKAEIIDPIYPDYQGFLNAIAPLFPQLELANFQRAWILRGLIKELFSVSGQLFDPDNLDWRSFNYQAQSLLLEISEELRSEVLAIAAQHQIQIGA
jgi:hypothetical protein